MKQFELLRWRCEVLAQRHGLWALPGALALLAALFAWGWWLPARESALAEAKQALAAQRQKTLAQVNNPVSPRGQALPPAGQSTQAVQRLFALAAENGLQIAQADYRRQENAQIGRWQVQVPATGTYPQVRRFLRAAQGIDGLSLDEMGVHRAGQGVEARLLFSIWFVAEPQTGRAR